MYVFVKSREHGSPVDVFLIITDEKYCRKMMLNLRIACLTFDPQIKHVTLSHSLFLQALKSLTASSSSQKMKSLSMTASLQLTLLWSSSMMFVRI